MLAGDELAAALAALPGQPFQGVLYRAIFLEALFGFHQQRSSPQPQPLYSLGSPMHGARYTPRGGMATLYMAEDQATALAEAHRVGAVIGRATGSKAQPHRPTVLVSAVVRLENVVDLVAVETQEALGTTESELTRPWRLAQRRGPVPTQELGAAVFTSGRFQALRYPSAQLNGHCCLAIFPARLDAPSFVEIYDPEGNVRQRLP
jgi:RES domain-containing protein